MCGFIRLGNEAGAIFGRSGHFGSWPGFLAFLVLFGRVETTICRIRQRSELGVKLVITRKKLDFHFKWGM
jgi:hypothetical protein